MAQHDDLKLPLTTTAGEHAHKAAQEPVQQTHQHDAQSEPARPRSPTRPSRPESNFFTPHAFSMLCGSSPIPASSGQTRRHRLNRGGNRQANAALYRIVLVRMRYHQPTKAYVQRRTSEGKSKREIIRCLKRYVAREVYTALRQSDESKLARAA